MLTRISAALRPAEPEHTIHAHFPYEPLRTLQRFHRWIHTDKRIKEDIILGVGSQIAFVVVMVGLTMVAHYGVLDIGGRPEP